MEDNYKGTNAENVPPKLLLKGICKAFGPVEVLDNINISVQPHEIAAILGPSGCGKSTLFNIAAGVESCDSGEIYFNEERKESLLGQVGYMTQKDLLLPWENLIDNVAVPLLLSGVKKSEARSQISPMLEEFGLKGFELVYPSALSGGMRQRAALLRAIVQRKEMVLFDEPFSSLDAMTRNNIHRWFLEIKEHYKLTGIIITHDMDEARYLADKIYILDKRPSKVIECIIP